MAIKKTDPDDALVLPIKIDSTSNGEYWPQQIGPELARVREKALVDAFENAKRTGVSRRDYLRSTCAAATTLLALNELGCSGGRYNVPKEAGVDQMAAKAALGGDELIFDVQTHFVSTTRPWWKVDKPNMAQYLETVPQAKCGQDPWLGCFSEDVLIKDVFLDSDTDLAVLSALWGSPHPTAAEDADHARERLSMLEGKKRLRIHGIVQPNEWPFAQVEEHMAQLVERWKIDAWKLYPIWGPEGRGYLLTEDLGKRTIEKGLSLGLSMFAVHKGLPLPGQDPRYTFADDVGPTARAYPKATFLIYHSGYEPERTEGPYDPKAERGVDALIRSCRENGIGKGGNVYAELGGTWRETMKKPDQAAHVLGKLIDQFGDDHVLWGTDAIWYGSPQDQIQAFRAFEITTELQEKHGYAALTPEVKRKIFGLNAAKVYGLDPGEIRKGQQGDNVSKARALYQEAPSPTFHTRGPRTRREMLQLLASTDGRGH